MESYCDYVFIKSSYVRFTEIYVKFILCKVSCVEVLRIMVFFFFVGTINTMETPLPKVVLDTVMVAPTSKNVL